MRKLRFILIALTICISCEEAKNAPQIQNGVIEHIENFKSKYVKERNIDLWLPNNYNTSNKYAVLYMHDGQMLFDPASTWNKQAWNIDDTATNLFKDGKVKDFIVVGIWSRKDTRHSDYFPQQPFESLTKTQRDTVNEQLKRSHVAQNDSFLPQSDNYLKFIVTELKPYIDKNYSVHTDQQNTFIMGSSMGGLISMYAICEYPKVFSGAACLSTHWPGTFTLDHNPVPNEFLNYLEKNLPDSNGHKIYFDCGDKTLDSLYPRIQNAVDSIMIKKGYDTNSWRTHYYPGEDHSENAWAKRLPVPLEFLFSKR